MQQLDHAAVKQAADIVAIIGKYTRLRDAGADEMAGECPIPGHQKSGTAPGGAFTVTPSKQLYRCFKCDRGGDVFKFIQEVEGLAFPLAVRHVAEMIGMADDPLLSAGSGNVERKEPRPGGVIDSRPTPAPAPSTQPRVVATYPYVDEHGELLYEVQRLDPKGFRQRRPHPTKDGEWIWGIKETEDAPSARRVLYRLPELLAADEVWLVEGERDVHTLVDAGIAATTNSGGASQPWLPEYSETLRGKSVVILPDQDDPGRKHGAKLAAALKGIAADVLVFDVPAGKDVTEYVEAGHSVAELVELVEKARHRADVERIESRGLLHPGEILQVSGGVSGFMEPVKGLMTGFAKFDEMTLGLHGGEVTILAARPAVGKTALAMNIGTNIARRGEGVAVFSLEMSKQSLLKRVLCSWAQVDMLKFRAGALDADERRRLQNGLAEICEWPLLIDDHPLATVDNTHHKLRTAMERSTIKLVIIDYLQLMRGKSKENRNQEVGELSRGLKLMAKDLGVPFLVLSQLSRASESRPGDRTPQLSDLRDSGGIEQDADLVTFIHREELYKPDDPSLRGLAKWIVAKQRNGPTGKLELRFRRELTRFENCSYETEAA